MNTENTELYDLPSPFSYRVEDDAAEERCKECGSYHDKEGFGTFGGARMCEPCVALEESYLADLIDNARIEEALERSAYERRYKIVRP